MNFSTKAETRLYSSFKPQTNVFNECQIGSKIYTGKISMTLVDSEDIFSQKLIVEVDGIFYEKNLIIDENIASSKEMNYSDLVGVSFRVIKTLKYDGKEVRHSFLR
ncbi:hypothetical protein EZS27_019745 [termite gut metagenome]|uniref:Uncharacterized protein n=1 Tax=termite gut metagenome TaxID=433724 RepID=A0A5J4RFL1_9ZZZZ